MKVSVIALDYDGTITRDDRLDTPMREAIADARRRGVAVMLVTGWAYRVTFVEAGLILAFAVFWAIQTSDLKTYANRKEKAAKEPLGKK